MLRTSFALCATGAFCGLLGACLSTEAVAALEAPDAGLAREEVSEAAHAYLDFGFGGSFEFPLPLDMPMSVEVDLRYVGGTDVEFFGDETPRVDGSLDYVQFLLVFGWWFRASIATAPTPPGFREKHPLRRN